MCLMVEVLCYLHVCDGLIAMNDATCHFLV